MSLQSTCQLWTRQQCFLGTCVGRNSLPCHDWPRTGPSHTSRLHAWNCAHLSCTPASTKEPKSGDKNSLHPRDSNMDPCVVFTEAVFGHFIQVNSDAAQWKLHKVLLHCDEPCNFLAHRIRRGGRSLATRILCNLCKFGVHPGHGRVNSMLGSGGAMYSQLAPASEHALNSG